MAAPLILFIARVGGAAARGAGKGAGKLIKGGARVFRRKPKAKLPKDTKKARFSRLNNLRRWGKLISKWFGKNTEEQLKHLERTKSPQNAPNSSKSKASYKDIEHQGFIRKKFFYKKQKFSDNKVLNDVLNDLNRKNKLKEHKISEVDARIDYIFNRHLLNQELKNARGKFFTKERRINPTIDEFPEPEQEDEEGSLWDLLRNLLHIKNFIRNRLKKLRNYLREKLKVVKEKVRVLKERAKQALKRAANTVKQGIKNTVSSVKSGFNKIKNGVTNLFKSNKSDNKSKSNKSSSSSKSEANRNIKKEEKPPKKESKNPDLEKGLDDAKRREMQSQKEIKGLEKEYNKDMRRLNNEIDDLQRRLDRNSWYDPENAKLKAQQGLAFADKARLATYHEAKILFAKGEGLYKQVMALKDSLTKKVEDLGKSVKSIFPKMFKAAGAGAKALAPIAKRIPLIGSILYGIIGVIEIANAKNAWEVRRALGSAIGGSIGGILGAAVGSILPLIGTLVFGIIGALIGELVGKTAVQFGLEPLDFLPFELYDAPLEIKQANVRAGYDYSKGELFGWAQNYVEPMIKEAEATGKYLDASERKTAVTTLAKQSAASAVNAVGLGNEDTQFDLSAVNPEAIEGAVVRVTRQKAGVDWKGRGFVAGIIEIIDGTGKKLFQAQTTERPKEGTTPNQNLRIPPGTYNMYWGGGSKHPDRPVLYNDKVPASRAIMIHKGNTVVWSEGCVVISRGDTWGGLVGQTGEKADAEKAGHELMLTLKALLGLEANKAYFGKQLAIKTQVFNKFDSGDLSAAKNAKGSEVYQAPQQNTVNKTVVNNTNVVMKQPPKKKPEETKNKA